MAKVTNKAQAESFVKAARELGCDEDEVHFEKKLKQVARQKPPPANEPTEPKGVTPRSGGRRNADKR